MTKYKALESEIIDLSLKGLTNKKIAEKLINKYPEKNIGYSNACTEIGKITRKIKEENNIQFTETKTNQYNNNKTFLSAVKENGTIMNLQEYCEFYGLNSNDYKSHKLCTHAGGATYNLASKTTEDEIKIDIEKFKEHIENALSEVDTTFVKNETTPIKYKEGVIKLADLHFGALIKDLLKTHDYSSGILAKKLSETADMVNEIGFKKVHIHILGDLIESFTGLNHINSFKSLDTFEIGANAIKGCTLLLHKFLSKINNLGSIKIIAGNHDRTSSSNKEDVEGEAANLISWGLDLIGYDVEFHHFVIKHVVEDICHILTHGHHGISKKSTKDICWDYGEKGMFNLICEGHLHSIIEKLSVNQRKLFKTVKDDSVDHRRMNCPSFFTGNGFSETLGYTSNSGFVITFNNGKGIPHVWYMSV